MKKGRHHLLQMKQLYFIILDAVAFNYCACGLRECVTFLSGRKIHHLMHEVVLVEAR